MKIDLKIFYISSLSLLVLICLSFLILPPLVMKSFYALEDSQVMKMEDNIKMIVNYQLNYLGGISKTISFDNLEDAELNADYIHGLGVDYLSIISGGKTVVDIGYDNDSGEIRLSNNLKKRLVGNYGNLKDKAGLVYDSGRVLAVSIAENKGSYIITAKDISKKIPNSFSMGHYFTIEKINSPLLAADKYVKGGLVDKNNPNQIYAYFLYDDIFGVKDFYSKSIISRDIYKTGLSQLEIISYIIFFTGIMAIILFLFTIKKVITERLAILIDAVQTKRKRGNKHTIPLFSGDDEIATLAKETGVSFEKIEAAKKEVEYKQSQLDSILVSMHDSVFIFDKDNKLVSSFISNANDKDNFISYKSKKALLPKDVINKMCKAIKQLTKEHNFINIGYSISKGNKRFWYDANISEKKDSKGEFDGAIVVSRDVTASVNMEKGINEKLKELERLNKLMVNRELKMLELKDKIKDLEKNR